MLQAIPRRRRLVLIGAIVAGGLTLVPLVSRHAAADGDNRPHTLPGSVLVSAPPPGSTGPDDITILASGGVDHGNPVIWTAYQNGIGPDGTPGTLGPQSTVAGYDAETGALVKTLEVAGKVDGLRADPQHHRLVATDNEDANSSLNVIDVETGDVDRYTYSPSPAESGNGGTDSVSIWNGAIFVSHSNPNDTEEAAVYEVSLDAATHVATLSAVFNDNSGALNVLTRDHDTLALTDPDTTAVVPGAAPRFGGQLMLISQGDGEMIFASRDSDPTLHVLPLSDAPTAAFPTGENLPPLDGFAVATTGSGTLYVVDNKGGTGGTGSITALSTDGWPAGTVFVGESNDTNNELIGALDLTTGTVHPLGNSFANPKELLFVPARD